ncbi:unnamed protein product, partial [Mesorhabditis belari]|uniref:Uncharacterized protein n=1 Tax=Mesorhabditis belari TaxID=2138241 RepID=A0AAF3F151_9BILA
MEPTAVPRLELVTTKETNDTTYIVDAVTPDTSLMLCWLHECGKRNEIGKKESNESFHEKDGTAHSPHHTLGILASSEDKGQTIFGIDTQIHEYLFSNRD